MLCKAGRAQRDSPSFVIRNELTFHSLHRRYSTRPSTTQTQSKRDDGLWIDRDGESCMHPCPFTRPSMPVRRHTLSFHACEAPRLSESNRRCRVHLFSWIPAIVGFGHMSPNLPCPSLDTSNLGDRIFPSFNLFPFIRPVVGSTRPFWSF